MTVKAGHPVVAAYLQQQKVNDSILTILNECCPMRKKILVVVVISATIAAGFYIERRRVHRERLTGLEHAVAELHAAQSLGLVQTEHKTLLRDVFAEYDLIQRGALNESERSLVRGYPAAIDVCRNTRVIWSGVETVPTPSLGGKYTLYKVTPEGLGALTAIGIPNVPSELFMLDMGHTMLIETALGICDAALDSARNGGSEAEVQSAIKSAIAAESSTINNVFRKSQQVQALVAGR